MKRKNWTREEVILAFNLYCKIPFAQYNQRNSEVKKIAKIIGRTPSSVALKLVNLASLDSYHIKRGVSGMKNASKLDKEIFYEFSNDWEKNIFESELLFSEKTDKLLISEMENIENKEGVDVLRKLKTRVNQTFFRKVVITNYENKCAVCNINLPNLLIASHIIPWSVNSKERLNPSNGICLSALYDKAFDKGLMTILDDYSIKFSKLIYTIKDREVVERFFEIYDKKKINLPEKFVPNIKFLEYHRNNIFKQ